MIWLGKYGTPESWAAYNRLIEEWRAGEQQRAERGRFCGPDPTVTELVAAYLVRCEGYYSRAGQPTGELAAIKAAVRPLVERLGTKLASEVGPLALAELRDSLAGSQVRRRGRQLVEVKWARNTINRQLGRIKAVWLWGVQQELLPEAVYRALCTVPGLTKGRQTASGIVPRETEKIGPVSDDIVAATVLYLPPVIRDMVELQRLTGMRPAEVCRMRVVDILREGRVWRYEPARHKTEHCGRGRAIAIGPRAQEIILRQLKPDIMSPLFVPSTRAEPKPSRRLSPRKTGRVVREAYDSTTYRQAVERACIKAGLDVWTPNQLRHSAATRLAEWYGTEVAQVVLGHAQLKTTEIYAEKSFAKAAEIMAQVG
jgi:integrase